MKHHHIAESMWTILFLDLKFKSTSMKSFIIKSQDIIYKIKNIRISTFKKINLLKIYKCFLREKN